MSSLYAYVFSYEALDGTVGHIGAIAESEAEAVAGCISRLATIWPSEAPLPDLFCHTLRLLQPAEIIVPGFHKSRGLYAFADGCLFEVIDDVYSIMKCRVIENDKFIVAQVSGGDRHIYADLSAVS